MLHHRKPRFTVLDGLILAALVLGLGRLALAARLDYDWNWPLMGQYVLRRNPVTGAWSPGLILQGLAATIRLAAWTMPPALILGTAMGLCRTGQNLFLRLTSRAYVEAVRNLPPLVLVFLFYYFFSGPIMAALGVDEAVRSLPAWSRRAVALLLAPASNFGAFVSAVLTLALYEGAYITEIVRAGVQSVERGQREAARALGLTRAQAMRHVIGPQAFRRILPPLAGQFISTIKDSAILAVISVPELTFQGLQIMASTFRTLEVWIVVLGLYLALCLTLSLGARRLEAHLAGNDA